MLVMNTDTIEVTCCKGDLKHVNCVMNDTYIQLLQAIKEAITVKDVAILKRKIVDVQSRVMTGSRLTKLAIKLFIKDFNYIQELGRDGITGFTDNPLLLENMDLLIYMFTNENTIYSFDNEMFIHLTEGK